MRDDMEKVLQEDVIEPIQLSCDFIEQNLKEKQISGSFFWKVCQKSRSKEK